MATASNQQKNSPTNPRSQASEARKRLALVTSETPSAWESCRSISSNLRRSYSLAFPNFEIASFPYLDATVSRPPALQSSQILTLAKSILDFKPDRIVFLDHSPHPLSLLLALTQENQRRLGVASINAEIFIHVYGDFSLKSALWLKCEPMLLSTSIKFITASNRQLHLLSQLIPQKYLELCPFGVDVKNFHHQPDLRREWRAKHNVAEDEFLALFTGRISLQKNVDFMIWRVAELMRQSDRKLKLFVAGRTDDIGAPLFGIHDELGASYARLQRCLESLPPEVREHTYCTGHLSGTELVGAYNAADCFLSLSLHHDEDFGMAPAEALCCGAPAILTSWGGYANFATSRKNDCRLIPVQIAKQGGLRIDWGQFSIALKNVTQEFHKSSDEAIQQRERRAQLYAAKFSVESIARILQLVHAKPTQKFDGFKPLMTDFSKAMMQKTAFPDGPQTASLYETIYASYV